MICQTNYSRKASRLIVTNWLGIEQKEGSEMREVRWWVVCRDTSDVRAGLIISIATNCQVLFGVDRHASC